MRPKLRPNGEISPNLVALVIAKELRQKFRQVGQRILFPSFEQSSRALRIMRITADQLRSHVEKASLFHQ
jgi:hypothetical protein